MGLIPALESDSRLPLWLTPSLNLVGILGTFLSQPSKTHSPSRDSGALCPSLVSCSCSCP